MKRKIRLGGEKGREKSNEVASHRDCSRRASPHALGQRVEPPARPVAPLNPVLPGQHQPQLSLVHTPAEQLLQLVLAKRQRPRDHQDSPPQPPSQGAPTLTRGDRPRNHNNPSKGEAPSRS